MSSQNAPEFFFFFLLLLLLLTIIPSMSSADPMSDLAKSLSNLPSDWRSGTDPCKWSGVSCTSAGSVTSIDISSRSISGSLPSGFFSSLPNLEEFSVDNNPLSSWTLPPDFSSCVSLQLFSASNCSLSGTIPDVFSPLYGLQHLKLSYNNLTGPLPPSFASSNIKNLWLNNQKSKEKLSGRIDVIGMMGQLSLVWLQVNSFTGPIPDVSNLSVLSSFNVRDNLLTGPVPKSLLTSTSLQNASLADNLLQGPTPVFTNGVNADAEKENVFCGDKCDPRVDVLLAFAGGFGYPVSFAQSWTGNDPCVGSWLGITCDPQGKDVIVLNFANQKLTGTISSDVASLTSLTKLILSNNNITGKIPESLTGLKSLQLLDVSNNNLYGKVPDFDKSVSVKVSGNPFIGQDVIPGEGGSSGSMSVGAIVGIVLAVIVLVCCVTGYVFYVNGRKRASKKFQPLHTRTPSSEPDLVKVGVMNMSTGGASSELYSQASSDSVSTISFKELERATGYFNDANVLGRGGFGVVYKGDLNGTPIAVKRSESDLMGKTGMAEFEAEVHVLQKTRHRHLVSFLGYCRENNERLLVYEYMPEGTLGDHLFDRGEGKYVVLNWRQRLVIALDVARGIDYLHNLAQESFIHRDLKPSNILLDKDLRAKVSDFGLVKLADKEKSVMTKLAGTFGYLAPEYALTGKVSTKVDVYAYGVILMELIIGRKALDESVPDEDSHLVMAFKRYMINKENFMNHVDPYLDLDAEARESIFQVAELALHCTAREPNQRPSMGHPVQVLSPLVDHWVPKEHTKDEDEGSTSLMRRLAKWETDDDSFSATLPTHNGDLIP